MVEPVLLELATWLGNTLFGGYAYARAKNMFGEDTFEELTQKARDEIIKKEENLIIWNKIMELKDSKIEDPTEFNYTDICKKVPDEYTEKCQKFFEDLKREYLIKFYNKGKKDPITKFLLEQVSRQDDFDDRIRNLEKTLLDEEKHRIKGNRKKDVKDFEFDIAISFAGEDRPIAKNLVKALRAESIRVFYDDLYKHDFWGKDLREYFQGIYGPKARFVLLLISKHYPIKDWTDFEFSIMRDEAKRRKNEFILPIKLDDTKMIGVRESIAYLDYRKEGIDGIVDCLLKKFNI